MAHEPAPHAQSQTPRGRRPRPFARYVAIALIVLFMPFLVLGTAIAATGTVTVKVRESAPGGTHLYLPVPALLFDAAVFVAPALVPEEALAEARAEIAPYRAGLESLAAELEKMPPGVLVEVQDNGEEVRITKGWRSFQIDVVSDDAEVHVTVPARLLGRALDVL